MENENKEFGFFHAINELVNDYMEKYLVEENQTDKNNADEFISVDLYDYKFHKGDLAILGGIPRSGKTSFALNLIRKLSVEKNIPVGYITTGPTDCTSIVQRLIGMETELLPRVLNNLLKKDQIQIVREAANIISKTPIFINDSPNGQFDNIEFIIKNMIEEAHVQMIIIDSFDFLDEVSNPEKYKNQCSKEDLLKLYKKLAQKHNIPIVLIMNINIEENDEEPTLSVFKKDMYIPRIANSILFLRNYPSEEEKEYIYPTDLIIAKNEYAYVYTQKLFYNSLSGRYSDNDVFE